MLEHELLMHVLQQVPRNERCSLACILKLARDTGEIIHCSNMRRQRRYLLYFPDWSLTFLKGVYCNIRGPLRQEPKGGGMFCPWSSIGMNDQSTAEKEEDLPNVTVELCNFELHAITILN